jgi:hypothetical protein
MNETAIEMKGESSLQKIRDYLQRGLENPFGLNGIVTLVVADVSQSISNRLVVDLGNCTVSEWSACPFHLYPKGNL